MSNYSDPFGFTKQTATLLRGLGASELIVECKKRNISTDVLHELTVQELIMLGTDPKKAEELKNCLNVRKRRSNIVIKSVEDRIEHFLEIIKQGEQQFCLIQAFIAYCRLRLVKERINTFIDPNKCLSASKILPIAVAATLTELEDASKNVSELEELILRLFAIIVFGCISNKGYIEKPDGKDVCLYNGDHNACNYGIGIGVLAFLASIGFLAGEYLFEQMSSVKTRKHFVLLDLGFSGFWAFLYFVGFCYLTNAWNKSETPENNYGVNNVQSAIAFSFFSIFTWAACAWFAFQRFKQGTDAAFAPSYEADPVGGTGYTSYPDATDAGYQEPPFGQQQQQQQQQQQRMPDFRAPAY